MGVGGSRWTLERSEEEGVGVMVGFLICIFHGQTTLDQSQVRRWMGETSDPTTLLTHDLRSRVLDDANDVDGPTWQPRGH